MASRITLKERMAHLLETEIYSDITFVIGEESYLVNAHKNILATCSQVLETMLEHRWNSACENGEKLNIILKETSVTAFKIFLKALYTDEIEDFGKNLDLAFEILELAHMYDIPHLLKICSDKIEELMDEKNCYEIFEMGELIAPDLRIKSANYAALNIMKVCEQRSEYLEWNFDFVNILLGVPVLQLQLTEIEKFHAVFNWWKQRKDEEIEDFKLQEQFECLLSQIKFEEMKEPEFLEKVVASGVLQNDKVEKILQEIRSNPMNFPVYEANPATSCDLKLFNNSSANLPQKEMLEVLLKSIEICGTCPANNYKITFSIIVKAPSGKVLLNQEEKLALNKGEFILTLDIHKRLKLYKNKVVRLEVQYKAGFGTWRTVVKLSRAVKKQVTATEENGEMLRILSFNLLVVELEEVVPPCKPDCTVV